MVEKSLSEDEIANDVRAEMLGHAKMDHNRHPDWEKIKPGSRAMITINNSKSRMHGKVIIVERLKNGLFRVVNSMTKSFGPILVDLRKAPLTAHPDPSPKALVSEDYKQGQLLKRLGMSPEAERDEHGRPTPFLMALRSVGVASKQEAIQKSKKLLEKN